VEILEHGPTGAFRGGRRGRLLAGGLAVAAIVAVGVGARLDRHTYSAAPRRVLETAPSALASLVDTGSSISWRTQEATRDFVVQADLKNHNRAPVSVRAAAVPDHRGFTRLAVAVLPGEPLGARLDYATVTAAGPAPVTLGWNESAQLTIAGRIACGVPLFAHNSIDILVDGVERTVVLPESGHGDWTAIARGLC
jgi:hypothetical protein